MHQELDSIESAIEAVKNGEIIIVVDDENRENEGDFLMAAEKVTPEHINFMAKHGRGLICAPLTEKRCSELGLSRMVNDNTDPLKQPLQYLSILEEMELRRVFLPKTEQKLYSH